MIQRIQTLYLLLATVLMSLTLFLPLATIVNGANEVVVKAFVVDGLDGVITTLPLYLGLLLSITTALILPDVRAITASLPLAKRSILSSPTPPSSTGADM